MGGMLPEGLVEDYGNLSVEQWGIGAGRASEGMHGGFGYAVIA